MSEAIKFLDGLMGEAFSELHTCMLGGIKSFDGTKMKADVIPLLKRKLADGRVEDMPVISQAPVMFLYANGFFVRPPLKPGDLVVVVFAERELDAVLLSGSPQAPTSTRHHGLEDAIVIGGWLPFSGSLPLANDDNLVIGHKNGKVNITITPDGKVGISAEEINISSSGPINIESSDEFNISAKTLGVSIKEDAAITRYTNDPDKDPESVVWG